MCEKCVRARYRTLTNRTVSAAQRLHNIDGKCCTAAPHTRNQQLIANTQPLNLWPYGGIEISVLLLLLTWVTKSADAGHHMWHDVTDACSELYVCDGRCTKWDRRNGLTKNNAYTVHVSALRPNSGKQINIGIRHRIFCLNIGTSDIGHFTRIGRSVISCNILNLQGLCAHPVLISF